MRSAAVDKQLLAEPTWKTGRAPPTAIGPRPKPGAPARPAIWARGNRKRASARDGRNSYSATRVANWPGLFPHAASCSNWSRVYFHP